MPTLLVQMGHAGRTTGSTGAPGEQDLTNQLGQATYARLNGLSGWTVTLLKADPPASSYRGDAFVAFHADGNNNPQVAGASVGHQTNEGHGFATAWAEHYRALGFTGTWHPDNYTSNLAQYYGVTNAVNQGCRRAFIAEVGTITNPAEKAYITSEAGIAAAVDALGIALGILLPPIELATHPGRTPDMIITVATPNHAGILSGGILIDITGDQTARASAQAAINAGTLAEIKVTEATWNAMLAGPAA